MGWASAGEIFDPVARALIDCNAPDETKRKVLGTLIRKLQEGDWDTEDESLEEFRHHPLIVSLFYQNDVGNTIDGDLVNGHIDYDERADLWVLKCEGRDGCGALDSGSGDSAAEHDRLVRLWASHDQQRHDGDGIVPAWMLCESGTNS